MKQRKLPTLAIALAVTFAATTARAELISPGNPEALLAVVKARGWEAKLIIPGDNNPYIDAKRNGLKTLLLLMNCNDQHKDCRSIQLYMGYNDAKSTTLERLNEWNKNKRFGRSYRDNDGDPVLEMDVDMDRGGISRELLNENLTTWESLMDSFQAHIFPK